MRKILFIVLFSLVNSFNTSAQTIEEVKQFADKQFELNNSEIALREYQRVYFFDKKRQYNDIYSKIADLFYKKKQYRKAVNYYNLAWQVEKNDSLKIEIIFKKSLCNFKNENYYGALSEIYDIPETDSKYFKSKAKLFEGIAQFGIGDYEASKKILVELVTEEGEQILNEKFESFTQFNKKYAPDRIERMSRILPGLGQIYVGDWKNGINSIVLIAVIVYYSAYTTIAYSIIDGILIISSWFTRYYNGGIGKARILANKKLAKQKSIVYNQLLLIVEQHNKHEHGK